MRRLLRYFPAVPLLLAEAAFAQEEAQVAWDPICAGPTMADYAVGAIFYGAIAGIVAGIFGLRSRYYDLRVGRSLR